MFIKFENIYFKYEDSRDFALEDISLKFDKEEKIAVTGPAGAGKSTLFYLLCGLYRPSAGTIYCKNIVITSQNKNYKKLRLVSGLVMQFPEKQIFESTVYNEIAFGPKNYLLSNNEIDLRVKESMKMTGLDFESFSEKSPFRISGGERRKVAIASILALNPEVVLFDEPTSALDYYGFRDVENCMNTLKTKDKTILAISHDLEFIRRNFNRIIGLKEGKLIADMSIDEIFKKEDVLKELELI